MKSKLFVYVVVVLSLIWPTVVEAQPTRQTIVLPPLSQIVTGWGHTCALTNEGGVKCWGSNGEGQLGNGTTIQRSTPVDVSGLTSGVEALDTESQHTCALTTEGEVKCWGGNYCGQLGDGTTENRLTPVNVNGLTGDDIASLATGSMHTCVLTTGGAVKCWGDNYYGQLGDGTTEDRLTPVDVNGLTSGVIALVAGDRHTCALTNQGGVKCWGYNSNGQLGDGTTQNRPSPVAVSGLTNGVRALTANDVHTCAVTTSGGAKCWGFNGDGQLGSRTYHYSSTPVDVINLTSGVEALTAGDAHTCALLSSGGLQCWGANRNGELGDGTTVRRYTPANVTGLTSGVSTVAAGYDYTCALTDAGKAKCWGANGYGQLGDGTTTLHSVPMDVDGIASGLTALAAGRGYTCALDSDGAVKCWGNNDYGQLSDGTFIQHSTPVAVSGLANNIQALGAGSIHVCVLTTNGGVQCWGNNNYGQLGDGTTDLRFTPVNVHGLTSGVVMLAVGGYHACVLTTGGGVKCWGANSTGQLGNGTTNNSAVPVDVNGLTSGVAALVAGDSHTCALTNGGEVKCWGNNYSGQIGDGTTENRLTPVNVIGLTDTLKSLATGGAHTCALLSGGDVQCWGSNFYGQLGDGTTDNSATPVTVSGLASSVTTLIGGGGYTCALISGGEAKCWGSNTAGQLGDGTTTHRSTPVTVSGLSRGTVMLTAGSEHTCALVGDGRPKCWGRDASGELGLGTVVQHLLPVDVTDGENIAGIALNYSFGKPGSYFTLTGENFPPSSAMTVVINNTVLTDTLVTNETGEFIFFFDTEGADAGGYRVKVSVNPSAEVFFVLKESAPTRPQEGGGQTVDVPPGIAIEMQSVFLPMIMR